VVIQRAVVRGTIANLVQTRNMFTAQLDISQADDAIELWEVYLGTVLQPVVGVLQNTVTFSGFELFELSPSGWGTIADVPLTYTGAVTTSEQMPNQVACVWIAKTLGRRVVGRKFWSGLSELFSVVNAMTNDGVLAFAAGFAAYIAPWTSLGGSIFNPGVTNKNDEFFPFVGGFVSSFLGSQRRRKPGVGM
jgi:hypothetical protein